MRKFSFIRSFRTLGKLHVGKNEFDCTAEIKIRRDFVIQVVFSSGRFSLPFNTRGPFPGSPATPRSPESFEFVSKTMRVWGFGNAKVRLRNVHLIPSVWAIRGSNKGYESSGTADSLTLDKMWRSAGEDIEVWTGINKLRPVSRRLKNPSMRLSDSKNSISLAITRRSARKGLLVGNMRLTFPNINGVVKVVFKDNRLRSLEGILEQTRLLVEPVILTLDLVEFATHDYPMVLVFAKKGRTRHIIGMTIRSAKDIDHIGTSLFPTQYARFILPASIACSRQLDKGLRGALRSSADLYLSSERVIYVEGKFLLTFLALEYLSNTFGEFGSYMKEFDSQKFAAIRSKMEKTVSNMHLDHDTSKKLALKVSMMNDAPTKAKVEGFLQDIGLSTANRRIVAIVNTRNDIVHGRFVKDLKDAYDLYLELRSIVQIALFRMSGASLAEIDWIPNPGDYINGIVDMT